MRAYFGAGPSRLLGVPLQQRSNVLYHKLPQATNGFYAGERLNFFAKYF
jgi:hypothetical protein